MLPKEDLYTPPMNIKVKDHRSFGRKPIVGFHIIKSLELFRSDPTAPSLFLIQTSSINSFVELYTFQSSDLLDNTVAVPSLDLPINELVVPMNEKSRKRVKAIF